MTMRPPDEIRWMVLLKFGQRQHLEELRKNGLLYLNPQKYFADLEDDIVRADRLEGTDQIHQPKDIRHLRIENSVSGDVVMIGPEDLAGPISIRLSKSPPCNLFCMFSGTKPTSGPFVDERNFGFGDSFILILNTQEFINRICATAKQAGFGYTYGLVEYYDADTYSGETGLFRKPSTFSYQQEFRFTIEPGSLQPISLVAGSLEDLTTPIHSLSDINRIVDFGPRSTK